MFFFSLSPLLLLIREDAGYAAQFAWTTLQEAERPAASCGPAGPQAALPVLSRTQILLLPGAERERKWPVGKISGAGLSSADLMSLTGRSVKESQQQR